VPYLQRLDSAPWCEIKSAKTLSSPYHPITAEQENVWKTMVFSSPSDGLLPRLRVRAHNIDSIDRSVFKHKPSGYGSYDFGKGLIHPYSREFGNWIPIRIDSWASMKLHQLKRSHYEEIVDCSREDSSLTSDRLGVCARCASPIELVKHKTCGDYWPNQLKELDGMY
jgi:hypothetical protein